MNRNSIVIDDSDSDSLAPKKSKPKTFSDPKFPTSPKRRMKNYLPVSKSTKHTDEDPIIASSQISTHKAATTMTKTTVQTTTTKKITSTSQKQRTQIIMLSSDGMDIDSELLRPLAAGKADVGGNEWYSTRSSPPMETALPPHERKRSKSSDNERPKPVAKRREKDDASSDGFGEFDKLAEDTKYTVPLSQNTTAILARLNNATEEENRKPPMKGRTTKPLSPKRKKLDSDRIVDSSASESESASKKKPTTNRPKEKTALAAKKVAEKEKLATEKKADKERRFIEKEREKHKKDANKLTRSHVDTVTEMMTDVSAELFTSATGEHLESFLRGLGSRCSAYTSSMPSVVKWRRRTTRQWNEEYGVFDPIPEEIRPEKHVLNLVLAPQFVELSQSDGLLEAHIVQLKSLFPQPEMKFIVIIEGLTKLIAKSKNAQTRKFTNAVRDRMGAPGSSQQVKSRVKEVEVVDEDKVEDALLKLQVVHGCLIYQTVNGSDSAEAISSYTQHISSIPYKNAKSALNRTTNFCMDVGQVRAGVDVPDTFNKMLQEVPRCTQSIANGIQAQFPNIRALVKGIETGGEDFVRNLSVMHNKNGAASGRNIGPAMSRAVSKVFKGVDEWEMET